MKSIKISHSEGLKEKSHHEVNCSPTVCLGKVFKVCFFPAQIERGLHDFGSLLQDSPN